MKEEDFEKLKEETKVYKYNSFTYLEYEHIKDFDILRGKEIILIYGKDEDEDNYFQVYWAANEAGILEQEVNNLDTPVIITFIPKEWKDYLGTKGFSDYAVYRDYYIPDISVCEGEEGYCLLTEEDCHQAAEVTVSCRWQSRGFRGETEEWFKAWINGRDPNALSCGSETCKVVIHKESDQIVGVACLAIYGYESSKGPVLWLREIAVKPEFQGIGIGKKLISQSIRYGKNNGAKRAFLMADDCNEGAIHLYKSVGFVPGEDSEIRMISSGKTAG